MNSANKSMEKFQFIGVRRSYFSNGISVEVREKQ